jgi:acyl-CoA dehydrogenase
LSNGTPEQQIEWMPQCYGTPDDVKIAAFGVSEPDAGSDVSSLRTRAIYDEAKDEWVLNGTKTWITNGGIANVHVIVASVDPKLGSSRPGVLHRARGQRRVYPWVRSSRRWAFAPVTPPKSCSRTVACRAVASSAARRSSTRSWPRVREGKRASNQAAMATFEATRPAVGAQALGIARAAYEYSLEYAKERKQFGRAIIENQAIAFKLANMKMSVDAARLLIWRASWMAATRKPFTSGEGSMSKLFASETAVKVTEEAIQILGGYGYVRDYPVERWHRDSKIYTIFEGTSETSDSAI